MNLCGSFTKLGGGIIKLKKKKQDLKCSICIVYTVYTVLYTVCKVIRFGKWDINKNKQKNSTPELLPN